MAAPQPSANDNLDPRGRSHLSRPFSVCGLTCNNWADRLVTTICVLLIAGITLLLVGFLVPRAPSSAAKKELTAREYEGLVEQYAKRGFILDLVMVIGLGCLLVGTVILSGLYIVLYFKGYAFLTIFPARLAKQNRTNNSAETLTLSRVATGYGGLEETGH